MAKILVADDNSNIQKMVGLALKDQGIDVVAVGNGEAAVRKISDIKPDLVLADVFMPVRNGYEVCKYVKDDSTLAHIPVILLVGAFDPLDEQEAQRVGADGVLKKPFVPPDPLISMVKSALTRAGVPLGNEPAAKSPKDTGSIPAAPKIAAMAPLPEAQVEPLPEEFLAPPPPAPIRIAAGSPAGAFGSLLETPEEDDAAFMPKPIEEMESARSWGSAAESDDVEEEADEEEPGGHGGWRPGGSMESIQESAVSSGKAKVPDWREEAFHGSSPAKTSSGRRWTPAETTQVAEVAEAPSVGVSTLEPKPTAAPEPFAGDAWAAAMASSVQEKISDTVALPAVEKSEVAVAPLETPREDVAPAGPANWASVTETPWELEAKKASLLAATWDTPPAADSAKVAQAEQFLREEPVATILDAPTELPNASVEQDSFLAAAEFAHGQQAEVQESPAPPPVIHEVEHAASETVEESVYVAEAPSTVNETQEVSAYHEPASSYSAEPVTQEVAATAPASLQEAAHAAAPAVEAPQPDMDALVARVLSKMSPDVLQRVTQEILKPVIEAIIKDELDAKK